MSAWVCILHQNSVHVLSDCAAIAPDGRLFSAGVKSWPIPHLNCVVAGRGSAQLYLTQLAMFVGGVATNFDEMKAALPDRLPEVALACKAHFGDDSEFDLLIAGSGARGPEAFVISNVERPDVPAWTLAQVDGMSCAPWDEATIRDFYSQYPRDVTPRDLDPERDGLAIMKTMRRHPTKMLDGSSGHYIGVAVTLSSVFADHIQQRVIHRWPDVVSQRIGSGDPLSWLDVVGQRTDSGGP